MIFGKAVVSCGLWKSCCEKAALEKAEDRLVRAVMSCGKLYAVGEIPVIPLKVCETVYKPKCSYKHNMFTIWHVNVSFGKKIIKFSKFFIHIGGVGAAAGPGGIGRRGGRAGGVRAAWRRIHNQWQVGNFLAQKPPEMVGAFAFVPE
jgi:hypothetical protein